MVNFLDWIVCPRCQRPFERQHASALESDCGFSVPLLEGKPVFTGEPSGIQRFEKTERGPDCGTPWRQANWAFLSKQVQKLPESARILDVGAGHGDFSAIFQGRRYLSLDVVPYPEVDLVCDLVQVSPFRPESLDAVVLMNVLEHVYQSSRLLDSLVNLLRPGGLLIAAVPFLLKIHQPPFDFARYSAYWYEQAAAERNLRLSLFEAYDDPAFQAGEAMRNYRYRVLPRLGRARRFALRGLLGVEELIQAGLAKIAGPARLTRPQDSSAASAVGYHIVFEKKSENT